MLKESQAWNEETVNELQVMSESLVEMLNNSLDLSKLEEGLLELNLCPQSIYKLIDLVAKVNSANAHKKDIKLLPTFSPTLPEQVVVDRSRLTQVIMNLVSNAIKFTPRSGKVEVRTRWLCNCGHGTGDCQECQHAPQSIVKPRTPSADDSNVGEHSKERVLSDLHELVRSPHQAICI